MQKEKLNTYPQPAIFADAHGIAAMNDKAQTLFPRIKPGDALPDALIPPEGEQIWEGAACMDGRVYQTRCEQQEQGYLYTFQPKEQLALSDGQLDGALYQLRTLMSEFQRELGACISGEKEHLSEEDKAHFARTFDRQLRLMDHLDFLRDVKDNAVWLDMTEVELGLLCSKVALECDGLLREMGIRVEYLGIPVSVFVRGDEGRLRDALTELISNCARRRAKGGRITIELKRRGRQAMICVTDDGDEPTPGQRLTMTNRGTMPLIPTPDMGAGLGLSVAERTMWLHDGALLISSGAGAPRVYLSLGTCTPTGKMEVHSCKMERNPGRNPYVIALSDVLPGYIVREDWKE